MAKIKINWFKIMAAVSAMLTQVIGYIVQSLSEYDDTPGVLDGPELATLTKQAIMSLRYSGVNHKELDLIQVATNPMEYQAIQFKEGDVMIYAPWELLTKLQIDVLDEKEVPDA